MVEGGPWHRHEPPSTMLARSSSSSPDDPVPDGHFDTGVRAVALRYRRTS
jgi:hypothetical protein